MKKAIVINDLSSFGKCSLTAAIPVLSALGIQCVPLATAVLTGQTEYKHYYCTDLTDMMPEYINAWQKNHARFDAIYSGFLTGPAQVRHVMDLIDAFSQKDTLVLVDPVMGDNGCLYDMFSEELKEGMQELVQKADIITPNITEACLLVNEDPGQLLSITDTEELLAFARSIAEKLLQKAQKPQKILITGIKNLTRGADFVYNLTAENGTIEFSRSPYIKKRFSGTGDLFSSCMCGLFLNGHGLSESLAITEEFLIASIRDTIGEEVLTNEGIHFEKHLKLLIEKGVIHD